MLNKFEVENFRRFKDTLSFDLTAGSYEFNNECSKDGLVKTALVYGENASGKSCLGWAIFDIVEHLTDNKKNREAPPHYLNANSERKSAIFKYTFLLNKKEVTYIYEKDESQKLLNETLKINQKTIIEYQVGQSIKTTLKGSQHLNKNLNPELSLSALKYIYSNTNLDLRVQENKTFYQLMSFVSEMLLFRAVLDSKTYIGFTNGRSDIFKNILEKGNFSDFELFLNESGVKCKLGITENNGEATIGFQFETKIIPISSIASTGTISLSLFYHWWQQMKENKVSLLFIDEFDASYHFKLSRAIVKRLKQINSQVILTTHNTALLDNDLIRPDCGFIIDGSHIQSLHASTSKALRHAHNIEKMYRAGGFNE
ncbi:MAG: ATP-binding protein [Moraxellaceae bacterium]|nr:ATP-binding protein [Moraxellaceae bacterium]